MKVGVIYTAKTDALEKRINQSLCEKLGTKTEIVNYQDLTVLTETAGAGHITRGAGARYAALCLKAAQEGADVVLSTCCVMGDAVQPLKPAMSFLGTPLVSIDEAFCRQAIKECDKVILLATAGVAAFSVGHTFEGEERLLNKFVNRKTIIAKNTSGLSGDAFAEKLLENIKNDLDDIDGIILSQPSMAFAGDYIRKKTGKKVYTAIDDIAGDLKK